MPSAGNLPNLGIELGSPAFQADSLPAELPGINRGVCKREERIIWLLSVSNVSLGFLTLTFTTQAFLLVCRNSFSTKSFPTVSACDFLLFLQITGFPALHSPFHLLVLIPLPEA